VEAILTGRLIACLLITVAVLFSQTGSAKAKRIVSTAPSITESLFALGLGDEVVGVSNYCHYPPEANTRTRVGQLLNPDVETIISLHPDLVIVEQIPNHLQEKLERVHIRSISVAHNTVEDVLQSDEMIARAAGVPNAALRLNSRVKHDLNDVRAKTASFPRWKAVFVVGHSPGKLSGFFVSGKHTYLSELLEIAGATNVFDDAKQLYPQVSMEEILARDPDVIVEMVEDTPGKKADALRLWNNEPHLRAVRTHRVFEVPSDLFVVPSPRVTEAAHYLAHVLHPESGL
jgi:iron complex transport system substrate-binding protein